MVKRLIEKILCRAPQVYRALVRLRSPCNYEKLAYLRLLKRGDVVVEIGANEGYFTRLFGNIVGSKGSVLAFEPVPLTRERLLGNVHDLCNITVLQYAISDEVGEFEMYIPGDTHGQASLKQHSYTQWAEAGDVTIVTVQCMPLALIKQVSDFDHIDFMKVDVEGAELKVLIGARDILVRDHPILHLEIETFLRSIGYKTFFAYNKDWIAIDSLTGFHGTNVVCAPCGFSL